MRLTFTCSDCLRILRKEPALVFEVAMPLRDDRVYRWTCGAGHEQATTLVAVHFEILAEVAFQALADGYPREAYLSFMGAIERLMEAFVKAAWRTRNVAEPFQEAAWRSVQASSERQTGLFIATWALTQEAPFIAVSTQMSKERNKVVHQGKIPSEAEAIKFGQQAIDWMLPVMAAGEKMEGWWAQYDMPTSSGYKTNLMLDMAKTGRPLAELLASRRASN